MFSFVRLLPTCERYILKVNERFQCKLAKVVPRLGRERSTSGSRGQRSRSQQSEVRFRDQLAESSFSTPWVEKIEAYNERRTCCPWNGRRGPAHSFNCSMAGMHLADALVILLSGDRYLSGGETDCPEVLHDGTYMTRMYLLPVGGDASRAPKSEIVDL